jgi:hypothetical protein
VSLKTPPSRSVMLRFEFNNRAVSTPPGRKTEEHVPLHVAGAMPVTYFETPSILAVHAEK